MIRFVVLNTCLFYFQTIEQVNPQSFPNLKHLNPNQHYVKLCMYKCKKSQQVKLERSVNSNPRK